MSMRMSKKEKEALILDSLLTVIAELDTGGEFLREVDYVIEVDFWSKVDEHLATKKKREFTDREREQADELLHGLKTRAEFLLYRTVHDRLRVLQRRRRKKRQ